MQDYITKILQNIFLKAQQEPTRSYRMLRVSIGDTLSNWEEKGKWQIEEKTPACMFSLLYPRGKSWVGEM